MKSYSFTVFVFLLLLLLMVGVGAFAKVSLPFERELVTGSFGGIILALAISSDPEAGCRRVVGASISLSSRCSASLACIRRRPPVGQLARPHSSLPAADSGSIVDSQTADYRPCPSRSRARATVSISDML